MQIVKVIVHCTVVASVHFWENQQTKLLVDKMNRQEYCLFLANPAKEPQMSQSML